MADDIILRITSDLDDRGFSELESTLQDAGYSAEDLGSKGAAAMDDIEDGANKGSEAIGGMTKSAAGLLAKVAGVGVFFKKMFDATSQQVRAELQLQAAIKNTTSEQSRLGKTVSEVYDEYERFAVARQKAVGIGDEETLAAIAQFQLMGVAVEDMTRFTESAQNVAIATGRSLEGVGRQLARVYQAPLESAKLLERQGIFLNESMMETMTLAEQQEYVFNTLNSTYADQAKAVNQASFGFKDLQNSVGDFLEEIGKVVLPTIKVLVDGLRGVVEVFSGMPDWVKKAGVAIVAFGVLATTALGPLGAIVGGLITLIALFSTRTNNAASSMQNLTDKVKAYQNITEKNKVFKNDVQALRGLRRGTDEYANAMDNLLTKYPDLIAYGIDMASSADEVEAAMTKASEAMEARAFIEAHDAFNDLGDALGGLAEKAVFAQYEFDQLQQSIQARQEAGDIVSASEIRKLDELRVGARAAGLEYRQAAATYMQAGQDIGVSQDSLRAKFAEVKNEIGGIPFLSRNMRDSMVSAFRDINDEVITLIENMKDLAQWAARSVGGAIAAAAAAQQGTPSGAPGRTGRPAGGTTAGRPTNWVDWERDRLEAMLLDYEEYEAERLRIQHSYAQKVKAARAAEYKGGERERQAHLDALAKLEAAELEDLAQARLQAQQGLLDDLAENEEDHAETVYNMHQKIIGEVSGLWQSALDVADGQIVQGTAGILNQLSGIFKSAGLGWAGFGIQAIGNLFAMFRKSAEEEVSLFEQALDAAAQRARIATQRSALSDILYGAGSEAGIQDGINKMQAVIEKFKPILERSGFRKGLSNDEILRIIGAMQSGDLMSVMDLRDRSAGTPDSVWIADWDFIQSDRMLEELEKHMDQAINTADAIQDEWRLGLQRVARSALEEMTKLQRAFELGQISELDYLTQMDELYNDRIEQMQKELDGIAEIEETYAMRVEAEDAIHNLKVEQLRTQERLARLSDRDLDQLQQHIAMSEELQDLMERKKNLEMDIESGRRTSDRATLSELSGLDQRIARALQAAGADRDVWHEFEVQAHDRALGSLGDSFTTAGIDQGLMPWQVQQAAAQNNYTYGDVIIDGINLGTAGEDFRAGLDRLFSEMGVAIPNTGRL